MNHVVFNYIVRFKKENMPDKAILETLVTDIKNLSENKTKELNKFGRMNINIDADGFSAGYDCDVSYDNEMEDFPTFLKWLSEKIPENELLSNGSFSFEEASTGDFEKSYICKNGEVNPVLNLHTSARYFDDDYMDKLDEIQNKASIFIEDYLNGKDYRYEKDEDCEEDKGKNYVVHDSLEDLLQALNDDDNDDDYDDDDEYDDYYDEDDDNCEIIYDDEEFRIDGKILMKYLGTNSEVIIPEGVRIINDYAFGDCTSVSNITIPTTVKRIENYAFNGCTSLETINIPDSVTEIGADVFKGCTSLSEESKKSIRDHGYKGKF